MTDENKPQDIARETAQNTTQEPAQDSSQSATNQQKPTLDPQLEKALNELSQMTELAKRTMADFQNFRRRQEEERKELIFTGNLILIKSILPILENFDRAKKHVPETAKEWFKGIEMSLIQLHKILNDAGLTQMETIGKKFDPNLHEAVAQDKGEKDVILEEFEKGYTLMDKVVQHAKVKVGNGEK